MLIDIADLIALTDSMGDYLKSIESLSGSLYAKADEILTLVEGLGDYDQLKSLLDPAYAVVAKSDVTSMATSMVPGWISALSQHVLSYGKTVDPSIVSLKSYLDYANAVPGTWLYPIKASFYRLYSTMSGAVDILPYTYWDFVPTAQESPGLGGWAHAGGTPGTFTDGLGSSAGHAVAVFRITTPFESAAPAAPELSVSYLDHAGTARTGKVTFPENTLWAAETEIPVLLAAANARITNVTAIAPTGGGNSPFTAGAGFVKPLTLAQAYPGRAQ
jgi:hypothetical protein